MKATTDFLLELGCEEIPAGMIPHAVDELKVILEKYLGSANLLTGATVNTFGTPRRLVAEIGRIATRQPDEVREVVGPPSSVAYDGTGKPTRAAESFAARQGVAVEELATIKTAKGSYVAARQVLPGRPALEVLAELVPRALQELPWPRTMYWTGVGGLRFVRPIRWIVAVLGGKVVPFALAGVVAGRQSVGHRFLGQGQITVSGVKDYQRKLRSNFVLVRAEDRRQKIEREMAKLAAAKGLRVHADPLLLDLVTYLNEYPTVILGSFEAGYLDLPEEILITVMRDHQKYFALERKGGDLAPHFLAVVNLARDRGGLVCKGHERVLRARFADARFFWESDQKCRLADLLPKLATITYQAQLGSYRDKVERMRVVARWLADQWFAAGLHQASVAAADRAAELAKCDLATEMVREFTELQGIVGGLYAKVQGEPEEIVWAVYDHYRPVGLEDSIPRGMTGCAVALADKLDTLVGCFAAGLIPSGSSDPFALRRAALGVVKIILDRRLPLSLSAAVAASSGALASCPPKLNVGGTLERQVTDFILERARHVLKERDGFAHDEVNAIVAAGADDLVDVRRRLEALRAIRRTKNFEPLVVAFKRIRKILEKAGNGGRWRLQSVRPELLADDAEKQLHAAAVSAARQAAEYKRAGHYREALQVIAALRPTVDRFFDEVLVMADVEEVRMNRLSLLAQLLREFSTIADFSEISGAESRS